MNVFRVSGREESERARTRKRCGAREGGRDGRWGNEAKWKRKRKGKLPAGLLPASSEVEIYLSEVIAAFPLETTCSSRTMRSCQSGEMRSTHPAVRWIAPVLVLQASSG